MQIIIIGAGGHGKVVADIINKEKKYKEDNIVTIVYLDDNIPIGTKVAGYPVIGRIEDCLNYPNDYYVIALGDNERRKKIAETYNLNYITSIHPSAVISAGVIIEKGTVVMANAVVNADVKIGKHCIINTGVIVEHDNDIKDYVHISPGALLGGNISVGERTWIGIGTVIKNNVIITSGCTIGAGAVVIKNIIEAGTYVGIPVRRI